MKNANDSCAETPCSEGEICIDDQGTQLYHCVPTPCEQINCTGLGESCSYNFQQVFLAFLRSN